MAILITGGAGYIGSNMAWRLLDDGHEVVVIDRLSTGFEWAVPKEAELVVGDIANQRLVEETIRRRKIDAIIHFAGSVVVPDSVVDPINYYHNNTLNSSLLIESAIRCNVPHFIFSSTAAVYGTPASSLVAEETPLRPESPYGRSKMMTEMMLSDAAAAHDLNYTVLRYFNVAGADPNLRTGQSTRGATHLIKVAAEAATGKRDRMYIFGADYPTRDGTCIRDFIHVSDLIDAHALSLTKLRAGGRNLTANCGYGRGYSVLEVIETVKEVAGRDFEVVVMDRRAGDLVSIVADVSKIRDELGWHPRFDDLRTIVTHAIAWEETR